jgi:superfamily II DNA or RNA helicase
MISLRPYQQNIIDKARTEFAKGHKRVLVQLPTGGGKTFIAGFMLLNKPKKSFFIVNRIELLEQTLDSFEKIGLNCGVIASGLPELPEAPVQICSVDTLKTRIKHTQYKADFVIWDECRGIAAAGWQKVMAHFGDKTCHLGLDATPIRTDGKSLGQFFDVIVTNLQINDLIAMGALVPPKIFGAAVKPDLSNARISMGDYVASDVEKAMGGNVAGDIVQTYLRIGEGGQGLVFCPTIAYSQFIAEQFKIANVSCEHLDGETPKALRDQIINQYRLDKIKLLSNVGLFTAGFDVPNVSYVADASPTKSLANYLQRAGRGARPLAGKEYYILADHAGNRYEHGFPDDDREWSLNYGKKKKDGEVKTKVRDCPECFMSSKAHKKACEHCGFVFPIEKREIIASDATMEECERLPKLRGDDLTEAISLCKTKKDFDDLALRQGYKKGWAYYQWAEMKRGKYEK